MDLITGLIGLTLAIVFAIVIYFIIVSSTKEKSYDEVKAEQKKRAEEYFAQGRSAKEKAKDKKLKKAGKKVKEKSSVESIEVSSDEVDTVKGHVVFAEPPAIVDEKPPMRENDLEKATEPQPTVQKQPSNKQGKAPTIPSKEPKAEKPQSQKPVVVEKLVAPVKQSVKVQEKQLPQVQQKPVDEVLAKTAVKPIQTAAPLATVDNASPSMKSSRKKRSEFATLQQMSGEKDAVNVSALMPLVHKAELSRTEIQVLIDVLLNKQQGSSEDSAEWIEGRQDPVVKLKKQLAEKEKALVEEQEAAAALQSKLRELRSELNSERHSSRQLEENLTLSKQELAGLGSRIQHLAEEKQGLVQQIQQLQAKLTEEHMLLCKVKEETQNVMQQELLAQRQQLEVHIARLTEQHQETIATLEAQMGQMAAQLQEQENVNSTLSGELTLLRERGVHLQDSAAQSQDLARQIKELHNEMERMRSKSQYEVSSLTEQLNLKRAEVDKLSSITQSLQTENSRLTHQVSSASVEAQQLRDENETLAAQVTASMERPATEGRENGDVAYSENKHIDNGSDKVHEKELIAEKLKDDIALKEKELSHFKTDVAQKEVLVSSLKGELDAARANTEKMAKEISSYKCLVQEQESAIKTLREDGESAHKTVSSLREEITRLSKDCATMGQLASRESAIEKLTSELNTHKTRLADQAALILTLQRETEKLKTDAEDSSRGERERLTSELNRCKTDLAERESAMKALTAQSEAHQATVVKLQSELDASKQELGKLVREAADATDKLASLTEELVAQKRKNDDLRSKNWKAMDALSTTEKTLETKLKESQRLVSETEKTARQEEQERTKQLLQRLLPHVSVDSKQDYEQWLKQLTANVQEKGQGDEGGERHATMLAELERQNCQLQAMVTHYKAIIADTEGMLNRLQSHVEQEEGRWGQQIQALQTQLEAVMQERDRLQSGIRNGPHMVDDGSDTN